MSCLQWSWMLTEVTCAFRIVMTSGWYFERCAHIPICYWSQPDVCLMCNGNVWPTVAFSFLLQHSHYHWRHMCVFPYKHLIRCIRMSTLWTMFVSTRRQTLATISLDRLYYWQPAVSINKFPAAPWIISQASVHRRGKLRSRFGTVTTCYWDPCWVYLAADEVGCCLWKLTLLWTSL